MYIYGEMNTDENARWKFSSDRIILGNALPNAKGRFADLKLATMTTKTGKETIVAKMLKRWFIYLSQLLQKSDDPLCVW